MDCAQPAAAFALGQPAAGSELLSLFPNSPLTSHAFCKRAYSPCNKTDAGNRWYGMGRVIEASRSSATDPGRSATRAKRARTSLLRRHEHPLCPA